MPSRATVSGIADRFARSWRHTRCAVREARIDTMPHRAPHLPSPESRPDSWQTPPAAGLRERSHALIDHFQANTRVAANRRIGHEKVHPGRPCHPFRQHAGIGIRASMQRCKAADAIPPFQRVDIVLGGEQGRRVDGRALEQLLIELAFLGHAKNLRQRPWRHMAFQPRHRAGRENQHAVSRLSAQHLLPGEGHHVALGPLDGLREYGAGRIIERDALRGLPGSSRNLEFSRPRSCRSA